MMRCATLMPSPTMLGWPLMSLTSFTGPRLMPMRIGAVAAGSAGSLVLNASRRLMPTNSALSGSPRKLIAAPSPVSRMMRSLTSMPCSASARSEVNRSFSASCSVTDFFEYSTRSTKTVLQMNVRLVWWVTMSDDSILQRASPDRRVRFVRMLVYRTAGRDSRNDFLSQERSMNTGNEHKIDPRLRKKTDASADAFVEVATSEAMEWLRTRPWVSGFVQIVDGDCSATVGVAHLGELAQHPGIIEVEAVRSVRLHLDQSVESVHGWDGMAKAKERQAQGAGVVIGIVDYGLDFRLKDFRDSSGKSRVRYLWDQGLERQGKETRPQKYGYGVEYSNADIDAALRRPDPLKIVRHDPFTAEPAISGHGTHVAGVAAGNGTTADKAFPARTYVGVAPAATLVFVHLNRDAILAQVEDPRGTLGNSVNLAHAIAYCFEKADELNMPCVINLSMGFNG